MTLPQLEDGVSPYNASVVIDKPVAEVFRFVGTDYLENHPRWAPLVVEVRLDAPGVMAQGARGQVVRKQGRKNVTYAFEVTDFQVDRRVAIRAEGGPGRYTSSYAMTPVGETRTRLEVGFSLKLGGFFGLVRPFMGGVFRKEVARVASSIKAMVET